MKRALHCAQGTSHAALLQELGLRPMSAWFDKRMLEMWHRIVNMPNTRLIKQVVMTPISTNGVRGKVAETWLVRCGKVLREWGIDVQDAKNLSYR